MIWYIWYYSTADVGPRHALGHRAMIRSYIYLAVMLWFFLLVGTCHSISTMIVWLWYWYSASHLLCHNQLLIATILWLRPSATMLYGFKGWWLWYVPSPGRQPSNTALFFHVTIRWLRSGHMICWTISNVILWTRSLRAIRHDVDHLLHHCTDRFKSDSSPYSASSSTTAADKFYSIRVWYTLHHHDIHRASILSSFYLLPLMLSFIYRVQVFWWFSYVFSPIEHMPATQIDDEIS